tara:strand:+ start:2011 stop:2223 length:213 start_codon:yes stop_codon:yes gene_type:complete
MNSEKKKELIQESQLLNEKLFQLIRLSEDISIHETFLKSHEDTLKALKKEKLEVWLSYKEKKRIFDALYK